ncbi:cell division protein FtsZ [Ferrovibrio sp.]|uniref:cell division protein FtsZ n=1 Tax=Ferrovibrio sp. TaxID=1917215 RepID=UPI000CB58CAB|nr:cell division protein FtsZ [Ferrovibrio sp.]PJI40164.1 MAG: cell division protein FtsZ [Ferrovibrio sp.]
MGINLSMPTTRELKPRIVVFGVGGAGGNAVNNMIAAQLEGVEFVAANTDAQSLNMSLTERRIQLGTALTQGLGCGARPEVGRGSAEESIDQIIEHMQGSHMAFVAAGMGGGTGTGAAPVIARAAKEMGILTVGVVTKPFSFEGSQRMKLAEAGIRELQQYVDTLIIIPNQNLFRVANEKTTFADAFKMADNVLQSGVRGITDLMVMPGLINLDFADVRSVMSEMGKAMMGTGEAEGDHRAIEAAERAIANPLLDDISMKGARGVLINITGGPDLTLFEVDEAANRIREEVDPEANIIVGSTLDAHMEGRMRVSVVATGIDAAAQQAGQPQQASPALRLVTPPQAKPVNFGAMPRPGQSLAAPVAAPAMQAAPAMAQPVVAQTIVATAPMTAGATALAMPDPVAIIPEPAMELPAPAALPESAMIAPDMPLAADPAAFVAAAPVADAAAPRPFAAQLAEAQAVQAAFMPPAAQAMPAPVQAPAAMRQPDPFAEADMVNKPAEPKKKASLFDRITGVARRTEVEPAPMLRQAEPQFTRQPAAPVAAPVATVRVEPPRQADLGLTATAERTTPTRPQDDLLDIPAFLRRQAN